MVRRLGQALLIASFLVAGAANARDIACGEACDSKMTACVAKCKKPPEGKGTVGDKYEICWNDCAKKEFHPCLDACKFPKPDWAKD